MKCKLGYVQPVLTTLAFLSLAVARPAIAQTHYTLTDLGVLPGGASSQAFGLNNLGQVVGQSASSAGPRAFGWTQVIGMQDIGGFGGMNGSLANGINAAGQISGSSSDPAAVSDFRAFLWDPPTGLHNLGTLPGHTVSFANGLNASSQVVGASGSGMGGFRAFLWSPSSGMVSLGALTGDTESGAYGINTSGQVVGYSGRDTVDTYRAFLWTPGGGMVGLGMLAGDVGSAAYGISPSGAVVGASYLNSDGETRAFLWTPGGGMVGLGMLAGDVGSNAYGINASGQVVGYSVSATGGTRAFVWDAANSIQDLRALVVNGSGWSIDTANAVNDAGQIAGAGTFGGQIHAILLTPVAPTTAEIAAFTVHPRVVPGGVSATGEVKLAAAASADVVVNLSSSDPTASVPSSLTIPAGAEKASFAITTKAVSKRVRIRITVRSGGKSLWAKLVVRPPRIRSVTLSPDTVTGGGAVNGTVLLDGTVGPDGITIGLESSCPRIAQLNTNSITLKSGATSGAFTVKTAAVERRREVIIRAWRSGIGGAAMEDEEDEEVSPECMDRRRSARLIVLPK